MSSLCIYLFDLFHLYFERVTRLPEANLPETLLHIIAIKQIGVNAIIIMGMTNKSNSMYSQPIPIYV